MRLKTAAAVIRAPPEITLLPQTLYGWSIPSQFPATNSAEYTKENLCPDVNGTLRPLGAILRHAVVKLDVGASSQHACRYRCRCLRWYPDRDMRPLATPRYTRILLLDIVEITRKQSKKNPETESTSTCTSDNLIVTLVNFLKVFSRKSRPLLSINSDFF